MENGSEQCAVDLSGLRTSGSLRFVPSESSDRGLLYDSLRGHGVVVSEGVWKLLQGVQRGDDMTPVLGHLPDPGRILQPLFEHGHLVRAGAPATRQQEPAREVSSGYL